MRPRRHGKPIKECQLDLFADRTSAKTMRANQLRLWFAAMAYVLVCALRRIALRHTQFAEATCGTIRLKLFKIGALVRVSVRRIKIAMASACPYQNEFALAHLRLTAPRADPEPTSRYITSVCGRPHCARHDSKQRTPSLRALSARPFPIRDRYEKSRARVTAVGSGQSLGGGDCDFDQAGQPRPGVL